MIYWDDFFYGMFKPIKDAGLSLILTKLLLALPGANTLTLVYGHSFDIRIFTLLFCGISFFDDFISSMVYDFKKSSSKPFDQCLRLFGIICGMVFFIGPLTVIYAEGGGSFEEAVISWIVSLIILITTMLMRSKIMTFR
jgi:hypothetical protein